MNLYLSELSKEFSDHVIALIMDQAGWHKAKALVIPDNIKFIYLPPYSPELNPVERLWLHIKFNVMNNKLFDKLETLENQLCAFIRSILKDEIKSICSASYLNS